MYSKCNNNIHRYVIQIYYLKNLSNEIVTKWCRIYVLDINFQYVNNWILNFSHIFSIDNSNIAYKA